MKILVCGSREWPGALEDISVHFPDDDVSEEITIVHGGCSRIDARGFQRSVDMLAGIIAEGLGFRVEVYPVDHAKDGPWPAAGPRRNARMLAESKPDRGLAFGALRKPHMGGRLWKSTGTADMVSRMLSAGIPVRWIAEPGATPVDLTQMPVYPRPVHHPR